MNCPCCGRPMDEGVDPVTILDTVLLSPTEHKVALSLANRFGKWVYSPVVINSVYGDRIDGGPDDAGSVIAALLTRIKRRLVGTPLLIESRQAVPGRRMIWR